MASQVEGIVDGGMGGKEALSGSRRLEPLKFSHPSSDRLIRIFGPIVLPQPLLMPRTQNAEQFRAKHQGLDPQAVLLRRDRSM